MNAVEERSSAIHSYELEREFVYVIELPPCCSQELEVWVTGDRVTVVCGRDPDPEGFGKTDRPVGFRREIRLGEGVDPERLRATEIDGVLELRVPKLRVRPRRVPVQRPLRVDCDATTD